MSADASARERIQNDLDASFVVEAAAGTGKTTALISRIVSVLQHGRTTLERIVAVTFTEKAAGEMKLRLRAALGQAREQSRDREQQFRLERALAALELAHINTIHGFCADLLRERPLEAGVDPNFEVLDESASDGLLKEAFDAWFQRVLDAPPEGVRRALRRRAWRSERIGPRELLLRACRELAEHRDFAAAWTAPEYEREANIDVLVRALSALGAFAAHAKNANDPLARSLQTLNQFATSVSARERTRPRDYDALESELVELARTQRWNSRGYGRLYGEQIERQPLLEQRAQLQTALLAFLEHAEADLAAKLQRELSAVVEARERRKRQAGVLDFVDLLLCTRDLLRDDARVRGELQARFSHLFVDEFQDTDPLQAEIVLTLGAAAESAPGSPRPVPGKLFVVGDPKQSIYRFRRADVVFYDRVKRTLLANGAELLHLTTSFRARPEIQTAVNAAFSRLMTGAEDGSQADYVPLSPYRAPSSAQPSVIALPIPEPYGARGELTRSAVEASYPKAVAAFVSWLLCESGWTIEEDGARVPVRADHVCLLFRRFFAFGGEHVTRSYVRGLEARRVPHVLLGGRSLHGREEIIALRAALTAIEWPDDELNVYATLRGPLFAIADDELLAYQSERGSLHPLGSAVATDAIDPHATVSSALRVLGKLHAARNRRPIADTLSALLEATRAHAAFAIWPTGEQALANVLGLIDSARGFEARGTTSFRAFVDWLDEQAERDEGSETPILEEDTEGVRLMTVHKAKGLEFPIVVLCDPTAQIAVPNASRYVDPERGLWAQRLCECRPKELIDHGERMRAHESAENVRLAYVAATRARDLLVVPVFGEAAASGEPGVGWADTLAPALYPAPENRRSPRVASACPAFGDDSVRKRPSPVRTAPEDSIAPGLHQSAFGGEVVWWDPNALELDVNALGGIRQQELLVESEQSPRWIAAHAEWQAQRLAVRDVASRPSAIARSVTELALLGASERENAEPIAIERTELDRSGRPRGKRFGSLVHATLAYVALDGDRASVERVARAQARLIAATEAEVAAAISAVGAALAHPLLRRAHAALELRREVPVSHTLANGILAEGVIDLCFREAQGWTVIDFKTDAELGTATPHYAEQVRLYLAALRAATAEVARGILLAV